MAKKGRGSRTHGHGTRKRGGGRRGGRGYAGAKDSKWIKTIKGGKAALGKAKKGKYGHFGKHGFTRGGLKTENKCVNVRWLEENFEEGSEVKLKEHGFDKLLGAGRLTKKFKVSSPQWSDKAEQKIKAAGGSIDTGDSE